MICLRRILYVFLPFPHLTCTAFQGSKLVASETMEIESAECLTLLRIPSLFREQQEGHNLSPFMQIHIEMNVTSMTK